jgi:hypothetical protein
MAVWTEQRLDTVSMWTTAEFPGYRIKKPDAEPLYQVWSPDGPVGTAPKFAAAEELVREDSKPASYECDDCGWPWPLPAPPAGAECDNCGGELVEVPG